MMTIDEKIKALELKLDKIILQIKKNRMEVNSQIEEMENSITHTFSLMDDHFFNKLHNLEDEIKSLKAAKKADEEYQELSKTYMEITKELRTLQFSVDDLFNQWIIVLLSGTFGNAFIAIMVQNGMTCVKVGVIVEAICWSCSFFMFGVLGFGWGSLKHKIDAISFWGKRKLEIENQLCKLHNSLDIELWSKVCSLMAREGAFIVASYKKKCQNKFYGLIAFGIVGVVIAVQLIFAIHHFHCKIAPPPSNNVVF